MMLQFKTRHCNDILLHGFDVSLQFHNWQVCTYFCVWMCLSFQFFCFKVCLLCMWQFRISHLSIKDSAYCLDHEIVISLINYAFRLATILQKASIFITPVAVINPRLELSDYAYKCRSSYWTYRCSQVLHGSC